VLGRKLSPPPVLSPALPFDGSEVVLAACADSAPPVQAALFGAIADQGPDAVLFAGDACYAGSSDRRRRAGLREWRRDWGALIDRVYAVPGNHDFDSPGGLDCWRENVPAVRGAPRGHDGLAFALEIGPVVAVGLTAARHRVPAAQLAWARDVLAASRAPNRIAVIHEPAWPAGPRKGAALDVAPTDRDQLWALLEDAGIGLVISGHEHGYSRRTVTVRRPIAQVIAAGAGGRLYAGLSEPVDAHAIAFHHLLMVADARALRCEAVALDGRTLDEFVLEPSRTRRASASRLRAAEGEGAAAS
jgi:3',5'-cyclic AMP phosphodiesterase CpdA